jgi:hypothetical protein
MGAPGKEITMPIPNRISASLSDADQQKVLAAIDTMEKYMPFLLALTPEEKQALTKAGDKSHAFTAKALHTAEANPTILPAKFDLAEMQKDVKLSAQMYPIYTRLQGLWNKVDDSFSVVNSEGFAAALTVYRYVKVDDDPELASVAGDLGPSSS